MNDQVRWLDSVGMGDVDVVGGKNASLGEMIGALAGAGVSVPGGFATTVGAFRDFLAAGSLDRRIAERIGAVDPDDVVGLARGGKEIRTWVLDQPLPEDLAAAVRAAYAELCRRVGTEVAVAVRSSATAEDLPDFSFAGQQETFLNVTGADAVLAAVRQVFASLFNDRAIAYRSHHGFGHSDVAISAGVQQMVRSDLAASGVAFTIDTESGFRDVVLVNASYGLGELLVQGAVNPDEFWVSKVALREGRPAILGRRLGSKKLKMVNGDGGRGVVEVGVPAGDQRCFSLTDGEVAELARQALAVEEHYGRPMDIEWAKDGVDGRIYVVQARPETGQSRTDAQVLERYTLRASVEPLCEGRSVGQRIGAGIVRVVRSPAEMDRVQDGDVLVADMTDPDWEPVMKRAAAIVTDRGGRTCHAAIIARELGIPAVVGTGTATAVLNDGAPVTVSCADGDTGYVYPGRLDFDVSRVKLDAMPAAPVRVMMNVATPERAFSFARLPNHGVGLARVEFVVNNVIGIHPRAILDHPDLPVELRSTIEERSAGYAGPRAFFVEKLREGVATIAAAFHPRPVIVRLSDFKSNEYRHLLGGDRYEPVEENPMIGLRGASRYRDPSFAAAFAMECEALRAVRDEMGFANVEIMVPFVRTVDEAEAVLEVLAGHGLERGRNGLRIIMMCEIPSNVILADRFLDLFDGFSIGSNDLTQFTLALDRDSGLVSGMFDERDPAVRALIAQAIAACRRRDKYVGICGQGPSDFPDFARWLVAEGIDSISLNPDTVVETWLHLAGALPDDLPR